MKASKVSSSRKFTTTTTAAVAAREPLKRVNYFIGQLLSAGDLQAEQNYLRGRHRRHNLRCHGTGIVQGLEITVSGNKAVVVAPGFAIDSVGNEVELCGEVRLDLPVTGKPVYVVIRYQENLTDPIPMLGQTNTNLSDLVQYSRTEESAEVILAPDVTPPAIALARLIGRGKAWRLDAKFKPQRVR